MTRGQRRQLTKQWEKVFDEWRQNAAKYANGDVFGVVKTFSMWEDCDDKPADIQVVANILEHRFNVDDALIDIKRLTKTAAVFCIQLDALRNAETWRKIIKTHFTEMNFEQFDDRIVVTGAPIMQVQGVTAIVPMTSEERWENMVANCKAIRSRVWKSDPHKRLAIIGCYGPSLKDNWQRLKEEAGDDADVISVSGSHDFLIKQGIVPCYHVECDPRPHKADNINTPNLGVKYLLGSLVHPILVNKLAGYDVTLWHPSGHENIRLINELEPNALFVGGGGNVGLRSITLLHYMGYRKFSIYGMDCSFSDDGTEKWAGPHAQKKNPVEVQVVPAKCGDRIFTTSPIMLTYATAFFDTVKKLTDSEFVIYGDSLLQAMSRKWMAEIKHVEAA